MLKAVIFDVDGVLVHSREANAAFIQALLHKAGYTEIDDDIIQSSFHLPLKQTLGKLFGADNQAEINRVFAFATDRSIRLASNHLLQFPKQLEPVLEQLHSQYRLAIVTSRIRIGVDEIFTIKDIRQLFDVIVAFEDYKNPKPDPEPLQVALKQLGIRADEAIYIGDSPTDIDAAQAAGMRSVFLSPHQHEHATTRIDEFHELLAAIETITG